MAAKAWGTQQKSADEIFFQNSEVSLCLMVNRRARTMRVIDFRAGPTPAKRQFVLALARREGVEKTYTLVERDEVSTWVKLGFLKEGNIPGFYKRSDAFMLGLVVPPRGADRVEVAPPAAERDDDADVTESATRIAVARATESALAGNPAVELAEKTLAQAKKISKEIGDKGLPPAKVVVVRETDIRKPLAAALKSGRALSGFEPFGRDVERRYFTVTARGGFELVASTESQACFGNAFLELLSGPKNDVERLCTISALRALYDKLIADGVVSVFSLSPSDDLALATSFVAAGFRRTGLLQSHLVVRGARKDAIIWSRKLANPTED